MRYIYRRLLFYLLALWVAITLNFAIPRLIPGNPAEGFLATHRQQFEGVPNALQIVQAELGVSHAPLLVQYWQYIVNLAHGNLGISTSYYPVSVATVIAQSLPWTIFLVGLAVVLAFIIGTGIGVLAAWRRGGLLDNVLPPLTLLTSSFPFFFLALLLLYVLGFQFKWFPLGHAYADGTVPRFNLSFIGDALYHAILPALSIVIVTIGGWLLGMRNTMINTLSEDYISMAQARGLRDRRVMLAYAARNAILPQVTGFALSLGYLVGGQVLIETVFSYPGVGYTLFQAIGNQDYPLIQTLLLIITVCVLVANLITDLLYTRLDPRARRLTLPAEEDPTMQRQPMTEDADGLEGPGGGAPAPAAPFLVRRTLRLGIPEWLARIARNRKAAVGLGLLAFFILVAIFAPLIWTGDPSASDFTAAPMQAPSAAHWLGTDHLNHDIFLQMINGARPTLALGFAIGLIATALSILVGMCAGFFGGWVDELLSLLINIFLVIPGLPLIIVLASWIQVKNDIPIIIIISLTAWAGGARVLRSQTLSMRGKDFVQAAIVRGEPGWRIVLREVLPNMTSLVVSGLIGTTVYAIGAAAGLAFLGLGNISEVSWFTILYWAQNSGALESGAWWTFVIPGMAIALVGTALALINYGIDEISNPRLRVDKVKKSHSALTPTPTASAPATGQAVAS